MNERMKKAIITGITGQDGAYLAEFLLNKGYGSTALNAAPRCSIPTASTTFFRIRTSRSATSSCTMAT